MTTPRPLCLRDTAASRASGILRRLWWWLWGRPLRSIAICGPFVEARRSNIVGRHNAVIGHAVELRCGQCGALTRIDLT